MKSIPNGDFTYGKVAGNIIRRFPRLIPPCYNLRRYARRRRSAERYSGVYHDLGCVTSQPPPHRDFVFVVKSGKPFRYPFVLRISPVGFI